MDIQPHHVRKLQNELDVICFPSLENGAPVWTCLMTVTETAVHLMTLWSRTKRDLWDPEMRGQEGHFVHWKDADQRWPHHWVSLVQKERDAGQGSQPAKGGKQKWPQNCLTHNSGMNELPTGVSSLTVGSPIMIMVQQCEMSLFVC